MSRDSHDDNCTSCRPALIDVATGRAMPDSSPEMQIVLRVWATTTLEERRAFHRVTVNNGQDPEDLALVQGVSSRIQAAMQSPAFMN